MGTNSSRLNWKKIVFPFFNKTTHRFLIKEWLFRLVTVLYVLVLIFVLIYGVVLIVLTPEILFNTVNTVGLGNMKCVGSDGFASPYNCTQLRTGLKLIPLFYPVFVLFAHYLIQFFFFRLIINFVVLGGKE